MNKYKYIVIAAVVLLGSFTLVKASSGSSINSQITSLMFPQKVSIIPVLDGATQYQATKDASINLDPVVRVLSNTFIAHIQTPIGKIDVQRFIDPSTNVACYYSEITESGSTHTVPNCVAIASYLGNH